MKKKHILLLVIIFLAFIALGLPDAVLGSAWNLVRSDLGASLGSLGLMTVVVYITSVISTYNAPKILRFLQTKKVVFISILFTGSALVLMSLVNEFYQMLFFAIPLGMGAGAIDVSLNHYLAVNYKAKHMNYLHSFYGVGVTFGPMIMAYTLKDNEWRMGYVIVGSILLCIALIVLISFKLWKKEEDHERKESHAKISFKDMVKTKGAIASILIFLFYVHVESLGGVWVASYIYLTKSVSYAAAALFAFAFYLAMTVGRFLSGILSQKLSSEILIRVGEILIFVSAVLLLLNVSSIAFYYGVVALFGLGCAPIYPNMMYLNKSHFERRKLSKVMSFQMAIGYLGFGVLTPLAGFVFDKIGISIYPYFILVAIVITIIVSIRYLPQKKSSEEEVLSS
ncbi:MAG: MFS transporter [Bacilli bacterium]|nr:MFS transporter [Bacilli bacterium]MBN2876194.1 MFS transporter [Bacilli bacterium]